MRTYYWKIFRHMLSTAVFAGFGHSLNLDSQQRPNIRRPGACEQGVPGCSVS